MEDALITILTDDQAREAIDVERLLIEQASVATAWAD
jgi:hypothetical protein